MFKKTTQHARVWVPAELGITNWMFSFMMTVGKYVLRLFFFYIYSYCFFVAKLALLLFPWTVRQSELCGRDFWAPLNLLVQFVRVFVLQLESVLLPITLCNSTQTSGMQCLENSIRVVKITVLKPDLKALESIIYYNVQINSCLVPRPLACNLQLSLRICKLHLLTSSLAA